MREWGVVIIARSKKERRLKEDRPVSGNFEQLKKALTDSGVIDKKTRQGKLVYWNNQRKFGFIRGDDKNKYFIHCSEIKDKASPLKGQRYEFKAGGDGKAKDVVRVGVGAPESDSKGYQGTIEG